MNIAILGAGFSGLASAWHLLTSEKFKHASITIIDRKGVGGGASSVSAGLLHPYAGARAKVNFRGHEGVAATLKLLDVASETLGDPVYTKSGLLRSALTEEQESNFRECAKKNDGVQWLSAEECQAKVPGVAALPGIYIEDAYSVNSSRYLQGLFLACEKLGATMLHRNIQSLQQLDEFDLVIAALGADTTEIKELSDLPVRRLKGQILEFPWPDIIPPLTTALSSQIYVVMNPDGKSCIAGSTFERDYTSSAPDKAVAESLILPKLHAFFPALKEVQPSNCRAGFRASAPKHQPLLKQINDKCWVLTGLGSKGLLYHALYSQDLVDLLSRS